MTTIYQKFVVVKGFYKFLINILIVKTFDTLTYICQNPDTYDLWKKIVNIQEKDW